MPLSLFVSAALVAAPVAPASLAAPVPDAPALSLGAAYSSHMVLQRGAPIRIEGRAGPGHRVEVRLDGSAAVSATAARDGRWSATLPARGAASGLALRVSSGGQERRLDDLAIGDVFLCSGQSNMELPLRRALDADAAIAGSEDAGLRLLHVPRQSSIVPLDRFAEPAQWQRSGPAVTPEFSAACYFMGRALRTRREVPVGLVEAAWGGSFIEAWLSREGLDGLDGIGEPLALLDLARKDREAAQQRFDAATAAWSESAMRAASPAEPADPSRGWEAWARDAGAFDGVADYETSVAIPARLAGGEAWLELGTIDDIDRTEVNGRLVGSTAGWDVVRRYRLAPGALVAGDNRLRVRVIDTGGGGGPYGKGPRRLVFAGGEVVPLDGPWSFRRGLSIADLPPPPRPPWADANGLTSLSNGMIAPLGRLALAGIAWYQGESDASMAAGYGERLRRLFADWRARFSTRRVAIVQLADFGAHASAPGRSSWAELREAQRRFAEADPDAALAVAIDLGDPGDIHPADKKSVGERLAVAMDGIDDSRAPALGVEGMAVRLRFPRPISVVGDARPIGFELCDPSACRFVDARREGEDVLVVERRQGDIALRFLWAASPVTNLYYVEGRPVPPFELPLPAVR